jgi:hypothetical protein
MIIECPECGAKFTQRLEEIVEAGTAACCECDEDCLLDEEIEVIE